VPPSPGAGSTTKSPPIDSSSSASPAPALAVLALPAGPPGALHHPRRTRHRAARSRVPAELDSAVGGNAWTKLVVLDELGYLALPDGRAELVFQGISERDEPGSPFVSSNLGFGEWTKVFTGARLSKAVLVRLIHNAHLIETGTESGRFRHRLELRSTPKGG